MTLGKNKNGIPRIENNVTVYPGAVIVEDIVLRNHCNVGANSYVDKSVEENTTVCGLPAKQL